MRGNSTLFWNKKGKHSYQHHSTAVKKSPVGRSLQVAHSNHQHLGARENQEDAFALSDSGDPDQVRKNGVLAVVADGMGGLSCGEVASQTAVNTFLDIYQSSSGDIRQRLYQALTVANSAVFDQAYDGQQDYDMGTTLVAAVIHDNHLYWIAAGDSRIYLLRDGKLILLSRDHIYGNHLELDVEKGKISREEADNHPEKDYLTSYLGLIELPEIDSSEDPLALQPGDLILLCSDGLYDTLSEEEIEQALKEAKGNISEKLVNSALVRKNKHQDNITVVTMAV